MWFSMVKISWKIHAFLFLCAGQNFLKTKNLAKFPKIRKFPEKSHLWNLHIFDVILCDFILQARDFLLPWDTMHSRIVKLSKRQQIFSYFSCLKLSHYQTKSKSTKLCQVSTKTEKPNIRLFTSHKLLGHIRHKWQIKQRIEIDRTKKTIQTLIYECQKYDIL